MGTGWLSLIPALSGLAGLGWLLIPRPSGRREASPGQPRLLPQGPGGLPPAAPLGEKRAEPMA